jgi:hypothetical protein
MFINMPGIEPNARAGFRKYLCCAQGVAQVVEHKHNAASSNPSTAKKKERKKIAMLSQFPVKTNRLWSKGYLYLDCKV